MADTGGPEVGTDTLFGGRLVLEQFRGGHRAGTDAVLLAAAADVRRGERFIDVGAGVGTVGLALTLAEPHASGVLLELDGPSAALAQRNVAANGASDRLSVACLDLFDRAACRAAGLNSAFNLVVSNPPFFNSGEVRPSPDVSRARAHVLAKDQAGSNDHGAWLRRLGTFLAPGGRLLIIHRPAALPSLLVAAEERLGAVFIKPVHAKPDGPAIRILFGARQGSKAPLTLLPPLVMHREDGAFTSEAAQLHQGDLLSFWPKENRPRRAG